MSESEEEDYTIEMMADDVLALLRHLRFQKVDLLGFSMGGLVVQAVVTHPDAKPVEGGVVIDGVEVRHVVLSATFAKMPKSEFKPKNMYVRNPNAAPLAKARAAKSGTAP